MLVRKSAPTVGRGSFSVSQREIVGVQPTKKNSGEPKGFAAPSPCEIFKTSGLLWIFRNADCSARNILLNP